MDQYFARKLIQSKKEVAVRGILAGFFISMGAFFFLTVMSATDIPMLGGLAFSLGLILCVLLNANLFTGDCLIIGSKYRNATKEKGGSMVGSYLATVFLCNFIGALLAVFLIYFTGLAPTAAIPVAEAKIVVPPIEIFWRAVFCNIMVCLAILCAYRATTVIGKIFAIVPPVTMFVSTLFEHSVAQMFFLPYAMLLGADFGIDQVVIKIILTTIGNILGGAIVGYIYLHVLKGVDFEQ